MDQIKEDDPEVRDSLHALKVSSAAIKQGISGATNFIDKISGGGNYTMAESLNRTKTKRRERKTIGVHIIDGSTT